MGKCPECGSENSDSAKFCKSCGAKLTSHDGLKIMNNENRNKDDKTKLIIGGLAIVAIILAIIMLYVGGVFGSNVPLETQEFDGFKMDVPTDSKYVLDQSFTKNKKNIFVGYVNDGKDVDKAGAFSVGTNLTEKTTGTFGELEETDGDIKVYKNVTEDETFYIVFKEGKDANVSIYGTDANTMKRMAASFEDKDFKSLYQKGSEPTTPTANTQQTSAPASTATSMSILSGSFSTGDGLEDKTYASIFVGPEHAGEKVTIQIFYSRDGATLNNGNMVPKTVTSDGYIEVRSADAYSKFPDFAEVNLYDSSGTKLLDSVSVSLNPDSGTQTF